MSSQRTGKPGAMARADDDSWDITEGVGQTALGVAWSRSQETTSDSPLFFDREYLASRREQLRRLREEAGEDPDANVPDTQDLWYIEDRTDVADWLTEHNWQVSSVGAPELMDGYARSPQDDVEAGTPRTDFVEGKLIC
jgi:O-methyltransferase involved in polyketide biosynthesis